MSGLSDEDREAVCICAEQLAVNLSAEDTYIRLSCDAHRQTVEAIVTRAVNEALTEAADAITARFDLATVAQPYDVLDFLNDLDRAEDERHGWLNGLKNAASIVRAHIT